MWTETRLDTTPVLGVPGQKGHSDIIKIYPEGGVMKDGKLLRGVLSVHDYKDGYLLVNAKDNTQGLIYLCAALFVFSLMGEFERVPVLRAPAQDQPLRRVDLHPRRAGGVHGR